MQCGDRPQTRPEIADDPIDRTAAFATDRLFFAEVERRPGNRQDLAGWDELVIDRCVELCIDLQQLIENVARS